MLKVSAFIVILTMVFLYLVDHDFNFIYENLSGNLRDVHHMQSLHDASLIIFTFIIACIAWYQLNGIFRINQADFLLRIDQRLGDENIIKARELIHSYYKASRTENPTYSHLDHCNNIANVINELGENKDINDYQSTKDYVFLLSFMDFLETVSLFVNKGYVSLKEVDELMNQSLVFFYSIFSKRIETRRRKYDDNTYYKQFEILQNKIKCSKKRCHCFCLKCFFNCH